MPELAITRRRSAAAPRPAAGGHPKAVLEAEKGARLVLPYAPQEVELGGLADLWEVLPRPGRRPLNLHSGKGLPTMSLPLILARRDRQDSIEDLLEKLVKLGEARERVVLSNMSPRARGPWRITDLAVTSTALQHGTNHITRATATLTLTAASDALSRRGPLSGGKDSGKGTDVRRYTVKEGESLRKLADRFLGSPGKWQELAKLNGIKRKPGTPLKAGTVIKVPKR